jgi:hypothetical protein
MLFEVKQSPEEKRQNLNILQDKVHTAQAGYSCKQSKQKIFDVEDIR